MLGSYKTRKDIISSSINYISIDETCFASQKGFEALRILMDNLPNSSLLHNQMAIQYLARGMEGKFRDEMQKAIKIEPKDPINYFFLATYYRDSDMIADAIRECSKGLEKDNANPWGFYMLGELYERIGTLHEALYVYKKALINTPKGNCYYDSAGNAYSLNFQYSLRDKIKRIQDRINESVHKKK